MLIFCAGSEFEWTVKGPDVWRRVWVYGEGSGCMAKGLGKR